MPPIHCTLWIDYILAFARFVKNLDVSDVRERKERVRCMPLKGIYECTRYIRRVVYHQCGSLTQAEIDSLHEEALRAAADVKQGNTKEGQELLIGLAQDGTIATRMSQHEMVGLNVVNL